MAGTKCSHVGELDEYELEIATFVDQFPALGSVFDSEELDFLSAFYSNHSYLPVFHILSKYFSLQKDRTLYLYSNALGISGEKTSIDVLAKITKLSKERIRQILRQKTFEKDKVFLVVKQFATPENYKILKHSIIRNIEYDADYIADKEWIKLSPVQFCGILRLLGYIEVDNPVSGNFMVIPEKFGPNFSKDWEKLVNFSQLKRYYPKKKELTGLFDIGNTVVPDTIEYADLQKLFAARLNVKLNDNQALFPINNYDILKFAKRLSEEKERPIAVKELIRRIDELFPIELRLPESSIFEILKNNSGISFFKIGSNSFYKSRMLRKYNVGAVSFFNSRTKKNNEPISLSSVFDVLFIEPDVLMETMNLYVPQYFQFYANESGDVFVGASNKIYHPKYTVVLAHSIKFYTK